MAYHSQSKDEVLKALETDASGGLSEAQAHYYLQKESMDSGAKLVQTAQLVLDSLDQA